MTLLCTRAGRGLGTRLLANVVCPRCALASAVFWLRHWGIVTTDMFQDERFLAHCIPGLFSLADLIELFKHLLIVAPMSGKEKIIMPSLLRMISSEEVNQ